jgi:hypothetical protein
MSQELIHLLFAIAGVILGWYARRNPRLPPELVDLLPLLEECLLRWKRLQERRQHREQDRELREGAD